MKRLQSTRLRSAAPHRQSEEGMEIYLSLLIAVIGVLMYALSSNPKLQEIGRISYFAGLLAFLLTSAGPIISTLHR